MAREIELMAADAVAGAAAPGPAAPSHPDCLNCGAPLQGRFCHACGQSADDHHRSILHLAWEAVEGLTHLDGRLARTLPALLFRPGVLARDYMEGRRARHVAPFRLFLVSLLAFMLSLETALHHGGGGHEAAPPAHEIAASVPQVAAPPAQGANGISLQVGSPGFDSWFREKVKRAAANPEYYTLLVFTWAHRLAVLLLPILAGLLTLLYVARRRLFVFDHLLVSMQYLSFCFLLWAVVWLIPDPVRGWLFLPATLWTLVNLFLTLRGAYASSVSGAVFKAAVVWVSTLMLFGVLIAGLLALALNEI